MEYKGLQDYIKENCKTENMEQIGEAYFVWKLLEWLIVHFHVCLTLTVATAKSEIGLPIRKEQKNFEKSL